MLNQNNTFKKLLLASAVMMLLVFGATSAVYAAEFPKDETIQAGETVDDDVFISGENVVIDGTVNGMLFATGTKVTLNGKVVGDTLLMGETVLVSDSAIIEGNLFIAGADLTVNGQVTGSVFGGSSAMDLGSSGMVGRNFYYGGYSLKTKEGSIIKKDLFAAGYQGLLSGVIERDLSFAGAAFELNNSVGRNATIDVGFVEEAEEANSWMSFNPYINRYVETTVKPGIRVSDSALVGGKLTYTSSIDTTDKLDSITTGSVFYQTPVPNDAIDSKYANKGEVKEFNRRSIPGALFGTAALNVVRNFLKLFVLGALAIWLARKPFKKLTEAAFNEPLKAIGWGFVLVAIGFMALFVIPLVFILTGILLGFLSLGSLLYFWFGIVGTILLLGFILFFFAVFTFSKIIAAYLFGQWLMKELFKQEIEKPWLNLLIGVFLYVIIRAIPILGWLAALTASLFGVGAFWLAYLKKKSA